MDIIGKWKVKQLNIPTLDGVIPVSYTHLDVYKRQVIYNEQRKAPGRRCCAERRAVEPFALCCGLRRKNENRIAAAVCAVD